MNASLDLTSSVTGLPTPTTIALRKEPTPAMHSLLIQAAHRREAYVWRLYKAFEPTAKDITLTEARRTRKILRGWLEKAAVRIYQAERPERSGEWGVWLKHARQIMTEECPAAHIKSCFEEGGVQ